MAVQFVHKMLGLDSKGKPNTADSGNALSVRLGHHVLDQLGITAQAVGGQTAGSILEHGVRDMLTAELPAIAPSIAWAVGSGGRISDYWQYEHLARIDTIVRGDPMLKAELGGDYLVKPDVVVAVPGTGRGTKPTLHAVVSCKFTLRSDRAQNIRHEAITLVRHRRGRQPHIVAVTAEPLPSRLAALCRGTGEVDAVYHAFLNELQVAVDELGNASQQADLAEFVSQGRLFDLTELPEHLSV